jgi:hypothetical protein
VEERSLVTDSRARDRTLVSMGGFSRNSARVAIDRSGQWWTGDAPSDLDEYVTAFSAENYPARTVVHASCASCGGDNFTVAVDEGEGCAVRTCVSCGDDKALLDTKEYLKDATLEGAECPCGGNTFNTAVGFAFYDGSDDVQWVYLALRCTQDGVLGCYADWKIDYSPSDHLLQSV